MVIFLTRCDLNDFLYPEFPTNWENNHTGSKKTPSKIEKGKAYFIENSCECHYRNAPIEKRRLGKLGYPLGFASKNEVSKTTAFSVSCLSSRIYCLNSHTNPLQILIIIIIIIIMLTAILRINYATTRTLILSLGHLWLLVIVIMIDGSKNTISL